MILLFAATAWALEPPKIDDPIPPPTRSEFKPVENECSQGYSVKAGEPLPEGLVDPETGLVRCTGALVPTSRLLHFQAVNAWALGGPDDDGMWGRYWTDRRHLENRYRFDTEALEWREEWYHKELGKPVPLGAQPWVNRVLGWVEGGVAVYLGFTLWNATDPG